EAGMQHPLCAVFFWGGVKKKWGKSFKMYKN
ncbi:MAG: hypothetical protein XE13_1124, partial [Proteiniphilum sp. 51_7]